MAKAVGNRCRNVCAHRRKSGWNSGGPRSGSKMACLGRGVRCAEGYHPIGVV